MVFTEKIAQMQNSADEQVSKSGSAAQANCTLKQEEVLRVLWPNPTENIVQELFIVVDILVQTNLVSSK